MAKKKRKKKIQKTPEGQKVTAELCGLLLSIHNLAGAETFAVVSKPCSLERPVQ